VIVIDTSAIIAILKNEPERRSFNKIIEGSDSCLMSIVSFVESSIVIENRYGDEGLSDFDRFIASAQIQIVPVDLEQAHIARAAFRQYGKRRHPAGLNFGDCFSYALAKAKHLPLLFKGRDFPKTDIQVAP
jgi:ribonuclease VapC